MKMHGADSAQEVPPTMTAAAPEGQANTHDIACPMCEYNLRGLTEPRCPECGYRFDWAELRDARRRPHRYLFEHHPEANVKSFWKTAWGGLRPWRFWKELHPAMPSRPGRLTAYWLIAMLLGFGAVLGWAIPAAIALASSAKQARDSMTQSYSPVSQDPNYLQRQLDRMYPLPPQAAFFDWLWQTEPMLRIVLLMFAIALAWPILTLMTLRIFRISMRRARVRSVHVLRCVIYSFDSILWAGTMLAVGLPLAAIVFGSQRPAIVFAGSMSGAIRAYQPGPAGYLRIYNYSWSAEPFLVSAHLIFAALLAFSTFRLMFAYRRYLQFHRPRATVLASQLIPLLLAIILALNWRDNDLMWYWRWMMGL
jgi:hypothetical protein